MSPRFVVMAVLSSIILCQIGLFAVAEAEKTPDFGLQRSQGVHETEQNTILDSRTQLKITTKNGFNSVIDLVVTVDPPNRGVEATINGKTSLTIDPKKENAGLSVHVSDDAPDGDYKVTITGTSIINGKKVERVTFFTVKVKPPSEFFLKANPSSITIPQGGSGFTTVKATATKSFKNPINLEVWFKSTGFSSKFSGDGQLTMEMITQSFTEWFIEPKQGKPTNTKLEIKVNPHVAPGTYYATIEGTMQNVQFGTPKHSIPLTIHVTANPEFAHLQVPTLFDMDFEHRQETVQMGSMLLNDVTVWSERPDETITFTVSVSPSNKGVSADINQKRIIPNNLPATGVFVTVAVSDSAEPGKYTVILTGVTSTLSGKELTQSTSFDVIVPEKNKKTVEPKTEKTLIGTDAIKEIKISKDDVKKLYTIAKLHEATATSLSSVNDQQKIILQKATAAANKAITKEQKDKLKPLLKEQDSDKKDIKVIQNYSKKVSNTIKKLAQKQGIKQSELDKITKTAKSGNQLKGDPVNQLKQDAINAKNNLDEAKKFQEETDLAKIAVQIGNILPDSEGRSDFEKRMEKRFEEQHARENARQDREREQKLAKQQEEADEKSKQHVIDMMQQLLELVQKQEQAQTDSILNTLPDPYEQTQNKDPVAKKDPSKPVTTANVIPLQSKRGTYSEPTNPCTSKNLTIEAMWILSKSSNIDSGSATVLILDLGNNKPKTPTSVSKNIDDGVIRYSGYAEHPGHYQLWLSEIDDKIVQGSIIDIVIPNLCTSTSPPPAIAEPGGGGFNVEPTNTKPTLTIPKQITQEATGPSGALVEYVPTGIDKEDGFITPICNPPPYSIFPIGATTVSCTVTDSNGNSVSGSFTVTIRDTTPPNIPAFQPREGVKDESGIQVFYEVTATDLVDGAVQVSCNYPSGYKFPIGVTVLTCTASDSHGNQSSRSLQITVTSTQSGQ